MYRICRSVTAIFGIIALVCGGVYGWKVVHNDPRRMVTDSTRGIAWSNMGIGETDQGIVVNATIKAVKPPQKIGPRAYEFYISSKEATHLGWSDKTDLKEGDIVRVVANRYRSIPSGAPETFFWITSIHEAQEKK